MLRAVWGFVFGLLLATPAAALAAAGYVHDFSGKAFVLATPKSVPQALHIGDLIESGNTIRTEAGSSAVIKFEDGQVMVLRENTGFVVSDYVYNKQKVSQSRAVFNLLAGGLRFITGVIGATDKSAYRMNVGATVTIGVRGTDGDVSYDPVTEAVTAAVNAGAVVMQTRFGARTIPANSFVTSSRTGVSESRPTTQAPPAVRAAVQRSLAHANVPINTPVVLQASAAAAVAQAQARQAELRAEQAKAAAQRAAAAAAAAAARNQANAQALAAQARAAEAAAQAAANLAATAEQRAQQTLGAAVSAAQEAYSQAIRNGATPPAPPAPPPPATDLNKLPPTSAGPTPTTTEQPVTSGTTSTPSGGAGGGAGGGGGGTASPN